MFVVKSVSEVIFPNTMSRLVVRDSQNRLCLKFSVCSSVLILMYLNSTVFMSVVESVCSVIFPKNTVLAECTRFAESPMFKESSRYLQVAAQLNFV